VLARERGVGSGKRRWWFTSVGVDIGWRRRISVWRVVQLVFVDVDVDLRRVHLDA
jgi:hypothetical protein